MGDGIAVTAVSILALDTASRATALVLRTDARGVVLDRCEVRGGDLDVRLAEAVGRVLDTSVRAVVVLTGPGSYSGVRAGMAAALGIALARSLPLHGLGNLAAIACLAPAADGERFATAADAGRGGVYVAWFVNHAGAVEQVSAVRRLEADRVDSTGRVFTTAPVAGLSTVHLDAADVLAAAVPAALSRPSLDPSGLSAVHAERGGEQRLAD